MSELPEHEVTAYQSKPYKKRGMSLPAKLLVAGGFVLFVGFMIGGENRPGPVMWAQQATQDNFGENTSDGDQPNGAGTPTPASTVAANDGELDSWYGEVKIGQYEPKPTTPSEPTTPNVQTNVNAASPGTPESGVPIPPDAITDIVN